MRKVPSYFPRDSSVSFDIFRAVAVTFSSCVLQQFLTIGGQHVRHGKRMAWNWMTRMVAWVFSRVFHFQSVWQSTHHCWSSRRRTTDILLQMIMGMNLRRRASRVFFFSDFVVNLTAASQQSFLLLRDGLEPELSHCVSSRGRRNLDFD